MQDHVHVVARHMLSRVRVCSASAVLALETARWGRLQLSASCGRPVDVPVLAASSSVRTMGTVMLSSTGAGGCSAGDDPCITTTLDAKAQRRVQLLRKTCYSNFQALDAEASSLSVSLDPWTYVPQSG